jgi:hypothetical protein
VTWLDRAAKTGFPCTAWFERDPLLDRIRGDVKFAELVQRLQNQTAAAAKRYDR